MKAVPNRSAKQDREALEVVFATLARELADGQLLCIFPEGLLTADGTLGFFGPGLMRVLKESPVPGFQWRSRASADRCSRAARAA